MRKIMWMKKEEVMSGGGGEGRVTRSRIISVKYQRKEEGVGETLRGDWWLAP